MKPATEAQKGIARTRRQWLAASANHLTALALAIVLGGMLHYLAARHYARWDWSRSQFYALSEKSKLLLASITDPVSITVLFQSSHEMLPDVDALLREYQAASPHLRVRHVDPERDVGELGALAKTYPITDANVLIFDSKGRHRIVQATDMGEYDYSRTQQGQPPVRIAFKGEQACSSALQQVVSGKTPVVYFLAGHGEPAVESFDRNLGYAQIARMVRQDNVTVRPLLLGERKTLPEDADALVIAGPKRRLPQPELDVISQYLQHDGRVLMLLDAHTTTGLEPLLERWGVRVSEDNVVDTTRTLGGGIVISRYGRHPITDRMGDIAAVMYHPRSVESLPGGGEGDAADKPRATALGLTSDAGWAETDPDRRPPRFDPGLDRAGPICVAVAVERGLAHAVAPADISPTRLVVFGDSLFVANGGLVSGNGDLFMSALNWALDREELMAISPKTPAQMRLDLTPPQIRRLGFLMIGGLPLAIALIGLGVWRLRRA